MGSLLVLLPEIVLVIGALMSAILGFLVGKRTQILWMWAMAIIVVAMVLTLDMMGLGFTRLAGLNPYEVPVSRHRLRRMRTALASPTSRREWPTHDDDRVMGVVPVQPGRSPR